LGDQHSVTTSQGSSASVGSENKSDREATKAKARPEPFKFEFDPGAVFRSINNSNTVQSVINQYRFTFKLDRQGF